MVRLAAVNVAPLNTDITPVPSSAKVAEPATVKSASLTLILATAEMMLPASRVPAVTLAPLLIDNPPEPATPTSIKPVTCNFEPAPMRVTAEPSALAVLAITKPARPLTVPGVVITVLPDSIDRLPTPESPTTNLPVLLSDD